MRIQQGGDFRLWEEALLQLAPMGRVTRRLGKFVAKPHKIWEWRQSTETNRLMRHKGHKMEVYCRTQLAGQRGTNKYSLELQDAILEDSNGYCTVEETSPGVMQVKTSSVR